MSQFKDFEEPVKPTKEQQAAILKAEMPAACALVNELREVFGNDVQVVEMVEGNKRITFKGYVEHDGPWLNAGNLLRISALCKERELLLANMKANRHGR